ncbi:hypothetical membrane protein [Syntrophus aciditrophicus SB]|uniref:Hypothetical membrane protein n=1 Tax=Syntrophus aciditrophicus (strain SB) TaxID=56780 RepID=Q2LV97_SYNAS|nr:hypothetical membrane protein [Syntrophus aciditrophicus SB]
MANLGVKSITMVHEIVIMLFFLPSFVVTKTTGPGYISVKALLIGISLMSTLTPVLFEVSVYFQFDP